MPNFTNALIMEYPDSFNELCKLNEQALRAEMAHMANNWFILGALLGAIVLFVLIIIIDKDFRKKWF